MHRLDWVTATFLERRHLRRGQTALAYPVLESALQRPKRKADSRDNRVPGPLLFLWICKIKTMNRSATAAREVASAVMNQSVPFHGNGKERAGHSLVIEAGSSNPHVVLQISNRRFTGRIVSRVNRQDSASVAAFEALANPHFGFPDGSKDAGWIKHGRSVLRNGETLPA